MPTFTDKLDEMLGIEAKPAVSDAAAVHTPGESGSPYVPAEESEFEDPPAPDEDADPRPRDPFVEMLDATLTSGGIDVGLEIRRKFDPTKGDVQQHDWETMRTSDFSDEKYQFRCRRCGKWLHAARDQTMTEALAEQGVDPDCSKQVLVDIQTS